SKEVDALQMLHQLISDKPDEPAAWLLGAEIALSQPQFLEFARDWTGEALKYFPDNHPILLQRAEALLLSGDVEHSLTFWRQAGHDSNMRQLAAIFICELLIGGDSSIPSNVEPEMSREFLKWYRAFI